MDFITKIELSDIHIGDQTYSFDFYRIDPRDEVKVNAGINGVPGLKVKGDSIEILVERTDGPFKASEYGKKRCLDLINNEKDKDLILSTNFPVMKLKLTMVRDPRTVLQSVVIPACTQASLAMQAVAAETDSERLFLIGIPIVALGKIKDML